MLRSTVAGFLVSERPAEAKDPRLIFLLFFSFLRLILIFQQRIRSFFRIPWEPRRVVYIVPIVLRCFLNSFRSAVKGEWKMSVKGIRQGGDYEAHLFDETQERGRVGRSLLHPGSMTWVR